MKNIAVAYYRYSDTGQNETSIEGQKKEVERYAKDKGITIIREYIDRAQTATTDKRDNFQRMITHSAKRTFDIVLCYQYDRFARNRYDSAINKRKLKMNGVSVISVKEPISSDPSGILLESVLEGYAEFFSADLSVKASRGMGIAADKSQYLGNAVPLGYRVNDDKKFEVDPITKPIAIECFDLAAGGMNLTEIGKRITEKYSKDGTPYFKNVYGSLNRMFTRKFYIGIYDLAGRHNEGGVTRLVSDETFKKAQELLELNKKAPARAKAEVEYLLTTKAYCGLCGSGAFGVSGTSKSGKTHHYYACSKQWKKKGCTKRSVKKDLIEQLVLSEARAQLTEENISIIAKEVSDMSKKDNVSLIVADLKKQIREVDKALERLVDAIEQGADAIIIGERIAKKKAEKAELEISLANAQIESIEIEESEIRFFLHSLKNGSIHDEAYNRTLINIFIQAIYLYDDRARIIFSATGKPLEVDYKLLLDETDGGDYTDTSNASNASNTNEKECSYLPGEGVPSPSVSWTFNADPARGWRFANLTFDRRFY
jgi:DNA invertase Pin-like site-specific DNA recombinase